MEARMSRSDLHVLNGKGRLSQCNIVGDSELLNLMLYMFWMKWIYLMKSLMYISITVGDNSFIKKQNKTEFVNTNIIWYWQI